MKYKVLVPAALCVGLAWPALAATTPNTAATTPNANMPAGSTATANNGTATSSPQISQKLRQDLTQAGYTNVRIVPESFLINADNKNGNPVMMVITPDSMTEVTAMNEPKPTGAVGNGNSGHTNSNQSSSNAGTSSSASGSAAKP